jgi:phosphohistidine phosphatase
MRVYLVQHGVPVPKEKNPDRPLSDRGRYDVERAAAFLQKAGVRVGAVYHSGKTRAEQTAEILTERLCAGGFALQRNGLAPMDDVGDIAQYVGELDEDLMIVGHLPHLNKLVSRLVTGKPEGQVVVFQQGGVCCLTRNEQGGWSVVWMIVPEIV